MCRFSEPADPCRHQGPPCTSDGDVHFLTLPAELGSIDISDGVGFDSLDFYVQGQLNGIDYTLHTLDPEFSKPVGIDSSFDIDSSSDILDSDSDNGESNWRKKQDNDADSEAARALQASEDARQNMVQDGNASASATATLATSASHSSASSPMRTSRAISLFLRDGRGLWLAIQIVLTHSAAELRRVLATMLPEYTVYVNEFQAVDTTSPAEMRRAARNTSAPSNGFIIQIQSNNTEAVDPFRCDATRRRVNGVVREVVQLIGSLIYDKLTEKIQATVDAACYNGEGSIAIATRGRKHRCLAQLRGGKYETTQLQMGPAEGRFGIHLTGVKSEAPALRRMNRKRSGNSLSDSDEDACDQRDTKRRSVSPEQRDV